jgi:hypothetical protein
MEQPRTRKTPPSLWRLESPRTPHLEDTSGCQRQPNQKGTATVEHGDARKSLGSRCRPRPRLPRGSSTKQRKKRLLEPASSLLGQQRKKLIQIIRERDGGSGVKTKHLRHARGLFDWLDERSCLLDSVNAISWAGDGIERNTDNYSDRLRIAQWACGVNNIALILPPNRRAKKPDVKRPFVDAMVGRDLSELFPHIQDPEAATFFPVIAATGCRPSEVLCFDWKKWDEEGRPNNIDGYSRKKGETFTAICHPIEWIKDISIELLTSPWSREELESTCETVSNDLTRRYSKLLKIAQRDLRAAGIGQDPTWTDLRHLWTVRADMDGISRRIGALAQAHSEKMASMIYLRHGARAQVIAEARRLASIHLEAC